MEKQVSRKKFIRLGAAIGVSAAGASVVAACGGGGGNGGATTTASSRGGATTAGPDGGGSGSATETGGSSGGQVIVQASEVPQNSAVNFTDSGQPAVLVHLQNGDFVAYSAVCTHQQCEVAYQPETSQIVCPCHGSIFEPSNGAQVVNGPAEQPLPEIPIEVQGGQVTKA